MERKHLMPAAQPKRERVSGKVIPLEEKRLPENLAALEAEAAIIGAILRDPLAYASVSEILEPADFFILWHGFVWYAFEQISGRGAAIDLVSVMDELERSGKLNEQDSYRLSSLAATVPSSENAETYAQMVRDGSIRLRVMRAAHEMVNAAFNRQTFGSVESFIDECDRLIYAATDQAVKSASTNINDIIGEYFVQAEDAVNNGTKRGVPSGFSNLDDLLRGAVPGELTVVAGAEGMGKTSLMLGMTRSMAKRGYSVAVFTLEMSKEEIARILISMESGLPKRALKALDFAGDQWGKFVQGVGQFVDWKVEIIDEFPTLTPIQLRRRLRTLVTARKQPVDVVIIDGLWLMQDTEGALERHQAVGNITRDLIQVGRDFNVPIYITHQYNGEAFHRNDKRPQVHDLAESAGVRRNAQVILGLYRDDYYSTPPSKFGAKNEPISELHVLKDRNGSGAQGNHVDFYFDKTHTLFLPKGD